MLLHGGAQNAHTWDTVALALRRPLIAVDLPGHGRSDWRSDRNYWPVRNAEAVAEAIGALAGRAAAVVGMSLGGLTAIRLAATRPNLVRRLAVVDVTPGVTAAKSAPIAEFVQGPEVFGSFDELLERTITYNPSRSVSSLRRGVLHNAQAVCPMAGGPGATTGCARQATSWTSPPVGRPGRGDAPVMLVCGSASGVVSDEDRAEFHAGSRRRGWRRSTARATPTRATARSSWPR